MDSRIQKLTTTGQCQIFERNAIERGHSELSAEAGKRAVQINAAKSGGKSITEKDAIEAIYANEKKLAAKHRHLGGVSPEVFEQSSF